MLLRLGKGDQEGGQPLPGTFSCLHGDTQGMGPLGLLLRHNHFHNWFTGVKSLLVGLIDFLRKVTVHAFSPESNCSPSLSGRHVPSHHYRPGVASESWPSACPPFAASWLSPLFYTAKPLCRAAPVHSSKAEEITLGAKVLFHLCY